MDTLSHILHARTAFQRFCINKERILTVVGHWFPSKHPLAVAAVRACFGDPLGAFRLIADNSACEACNSLGEEAFSQAAGAPPTDLFYGSSLRALAPDAPPTTSPWLRHGQWLGLWDLAAFTEAVYAAEAFMHAARAMTSLPRARTKLDRCERRWRESWRKIMVALQGVTIDLRDVVVIEMALHRRGLPSDLSAQVFEFLASWPQAVTDARPKWKRRRLS